MGSEKSFYRCNYIDLRGGLSEFNNIFICQIFSDFINCINYFVGILYEFQNSLPTDRSYYGWFIYL